MPAFVANQLRVLAAILDGIARGEFMVAPYEERGACTYCDFNDICPRPRTARERTRAPAPSGTPACQANQQTRVSAAARSAEGWLVTRGLLLSEKPAFSCARPGRDRRHASRGGRVSENLDRERAPGVHAGSGPAACCASSRAPRRSGIGPIVTSAASPSASIRSPRRPCGRRTRNGRAASARARTGFGCCYQIENQHSARSSARIVNRATSTAFRLCLVALSNHQREAAVCRSRRKAWSSAGRRYRICGIPIEAEV